MKEVYDEDVARYGKPEDDKDHRVGNPIGPSSNLWLRMLSVEVEKIERVVKKGRGGKKRKLAALQGTEQTDEQSDEQQTDEPQDEI